MFGKLFVTLSLAATALAQFSINTPAAYVQCQPVQITWTGGTAPFILAVIPGGQTSAPAISTLSTSLTSSPYTWTVNLAAGTSITLKLTDATGAITYNLARDIQAGADNSCLNTSASTSGLATTGAITTTGSGSSVLTGTTSAAATTSTTSVAVVSSSVRTSAPASSAASSAASAVGSSAATAASSGAAAASSAAASAKPSSAAAPAAVAGLPALLAGVVGGIAVLL